MATGIFIENEGDQLMASIENYADGQCVEIVIHEAEKESAMIRITSKEEFDKFVDGLRNLYYDMRHSAETAQKSGVVLNYVAPEDSADGKGVQS